MCTNRDPRTSLFDRIMGTFPSYKPTAGIESGGVVLQKPRIKMFRGPGPDNRGGGLFICEFNVSAIVVNLYMRRYIR
jgi:hypothetical protein